HRCLPVEIAMQAGLDEAGVALLFTTDGHPPAPQEKAGEVLETALAQRLGPLPEGLRLVLRLPRIHHHPEAAIDPALTGSAAVLLDAAIRGKAPGAAVLAVVERDGSLSLPPRFWETLRELSDQPGLRLVVPQAAL